MDIMNTLPVDVTTMMSQAKKTPNPHQDIDKAAQEFEAVYIGQMLEHMFKGIEVDPITGGGGSENIYKSLQIQEYAKIITDKGGIGIADALKAELIQMQAQEVR